MASWFGSFTGGFAKGMSEQITKKEEDQAALTANSIANMYHNVQTKKKEMDIQKEAARGIVSQLGSFTFKDGTKFDDKQLITLASNPENAKIIIKKLEEDPKLFSKITPDFVKAAENAPAGKATEYLDNLFKIPVAAKEQTEALFNTAGKEGGFIDKLVAQNGYAQAAKAASKYGMSLEQLVGYQSITSRRDANMVGSIDFSKLAKPEKLDEYANEIQMNILNTSDIAEKEKLSVKLAEAKVVKASFDLGHKTTEEDKRSNLADQAQDPKATPAQRAIAKTALEQRVQMFHKHEANNDKVTAGNMITAASRGYMETLESLAPGKFIHTVGADGSIISQPKTVADDAVKQARAQAQNAVMSQFVTTDGKPKSMMAQAALISIGIKFDQNGKAIKAVPQNVVMSATSVESAAPAAAPTPASTSGPSGRTTPTPSTKVATQAEVRAYAASKNISETAAAQALKEAGYTIR
jgi:hypothetical protein